MPCWQKSVNLFYMFMKFRRSYKAEKNNGSGSKSFTIVCGEDKYLYGTDQSRNNQRSTKKRR